MRVYKAKYKDRQGNIRETKRYYVDFRDADDVRRKVPCYTDRRQTKKLAEKIEQLIILKHNNEPLSRELDQWLQSIPQDIFNNFMRIGLIDELKAKSTKPLAEHLEDFEKSLLAKGGTAKNAKQAKSRVKRVFDECKFTFWNDIQASKAQHTISGLRKVVKTKKGLKDLGEISAQTYNFYLKAVKQFCKWMVLDGRTSKSPVEHLQTINVRADRRHDRRSLEPDEIRRLLEATQAAGKRFGMTGHQRALLYRLAVETGLRRNELKSLMVSSFDFKRCMVTVDAAYTKNSKTATLPLRLDTAEQLKDFVRGKMPNVQVFIVPDKTAKMIQADLADAKIPYVDDAGRFADFHSLRHSTGSLLAASGAHPKVVQSIMRHSDINLTMSRYTHIFSGQESEAVAGLPDLSLPSKQSQKAIGTGTDNRPVKAAQNGKEKLTLKLTPKSTPTAFSGCNQSATVGNEQDTTDKNDSDCNCLNGRNLDSESDSLSADVTDKSQPRLKGFEPLTFGSVDRRSIHLGYRRNS